MAFLDTHRLERYKLIGSSDYGMWKFKIQTILKREDLWEFVERIVGEPLSGAIMVELLDSREMNLPKKLKK